MVRRPLVQDTAIALFGIFTAIAAAAPSFQPDTALAFDHFHRNLPILDRRATADDCNSTQKWCQTRCIALGETCCNDQVSPGGYCYVDHHCFLEKDRIKWSCCRDGKVCTGAGSTVYGASTPASLMTATSSLIVPTSKPAAVTTKSTTTSRESVPSPASVASSVSPIATATSSSSSQTSSAGASASSPTSSGAATVDKDNNSSSNNDDKKDGLSGGGVAGVVIGVIGGLAAIGALVWLFVLRPRKSSPPPASVAIPLGSEPSSADPRMKYLYPDPSMKYRYPAQVQEYAYPAQHQGMEHAAQGVPMLPHEYQHGYGAPPPQPPSELEQMPQMPVELGNSAARR